MWTLVLSKVLTYESGNGMSVVPLTDFSYCEETRSLCQIP